MRHIVLTAALAVVLVVVAWNVVLAGDFITDAVQALQKTSVYVYPGTEGTDIYTAGKLQMMLKNNDSIVLVMLPASAESELEVNPLTIASQLSEKLGNKRIIGLAVGKKVVGYAPILPVGVADDQMRRAQSVSNDPITALGTYAQNIHLWQKDNQRSAPTPTPEPTPTPLSPETTQEGGSSLFVWIAFAGIAGVVWAWLYITHHPEQSEADRTKFKAPSKSRVGELLTSIAILRPQIQSEQLRQAVTNICRDTEAYFKKYSSDVQRDSTLFENYLDSILEVLTKYLEIQDPNNRRYYRDATQLLQEGEDSVKDFAVYVLDSCQQGSDASLLEYRVKNKIVSAQRYR